MMLALLVLIAGCKKNKFSTLEVGAEQKMIVTNQDKVLTPEKGTDMVQTLVDLDDDGAVDVSFRINKVVSLCSEYQSQWSFTVECLNQNVQILENKNTNLLNANVGPFVNISPDGMGSPRYVSTTVVSCVATDWDYQISQFNAATAFESEIEVEYDAYEWGNAETSLSLALSNSSETVFEFTEDEDSLVGCRIEVDESCNSLKTDQRTFLVYRLIIDDKFYKGGWIELLRTKDHQLYILRTSISQKKAKF
jgi:hypothetical protein